jgi:hypothetical protein
MYHMIWSFTKQISPDNLLYDYAKEKIKGVILLLLSPVFSWYVQGNFPYPK